MYLFLKNLFLTFCLSVSVLPSTGYTGYVPAGPPVGVAGAPLYAEAPPPYSEVSISFKIVWQ